MHRALFLCEGSSAHGVSIHIERIATLCGIDLHLTVPDSEMIPSRDKSVAGKLTGIKRIGGRYDVVFVHRDADRAGLTGRKRRSLLAAFSHNRRRILEQLDPNGSIKRLAS